MTEHEQFMERAMALAKQSIEDGNRPAGCVIVEDGKIVGEGRNLCHTEIDPTAHGEIVAIRRTALNLGSVDLSGCTLYTSMEPCPMCCWAMIDAKIPRLVLGCRHAQLGRRDIGTYTVEALVAMTGTPLAIVEELSAEVAKAMASPALRNHTMELGATPLGTTPAEFEAFGRNEVSRWTRIIKQAGIKLA